jgi:hypothetical protein
MLPADWCLSPGVSSSWSGAVVVIGGWPMIRAPRIRTRPMNIIVAPDREAEIPEIGAITKTKFPNDLVLKYSTPRAQEQRT